MLYDYLIVGAGLFGAVFAYEAKKKGKKVLVIEKRTHIAGNIYTENISGITVHKYGAHIFHTNDKKIWNYIRQFGEFNNFINSPIANYKGKLFNLPFNMNTFYQIWGKGTPSEIKGILEKQKADSACEHPENLEQQALSLVGRDIYEILIKGYTEKQWGRPCTLLPAFIIKRLPVRFTFDNNYFNALYQGIPIEGYTKLVERMLEGIEVKLNTDYLVNREEFNSISKKILYTGTIDSFFEYKYGALPYRSVRFEQELLEKENYQGVAVMNFTDKSIPYTRIIEHKHFAFGHQPVTIISKEYPMECKKGNEPFYPINSIESNEKFKRYIELANSQNKVIFGGRLGMYRYFDMDRIIYESLKLAEETL